MSATVSDRSFGALSIALIFLIFFLSSDDVVFVFRFQGMTIRLAQVLQIVFFLVSIAAIFRSKKISFPPAFVVLFAWLLWMIPGVFNSPILVRSVGYYFWTIFNVLFVFAMFNFAGAFPGGWAKLLRVYFYSFAAMALLVIFQFMSGLLFGYAPLSISWLVPGLIARANGFSYEPSSIGTYFIGGWSTIFVLWYFKSRILSVRALNILVGLLTVALVLTTSRASIMIMAGVFTAVVLTDFYLSFFKGRFRTSTLLMTFLTLFGVFILVVSILFLIDIKSYAYLFEGLGIFGTSEHSVLDRLTSIEETIYVWSQFPWFGVGLGGIGPQIAVNTGVSYTAIDLAEKIEGLNVTAELFAGCGVGGALFLIYLLRMVLKLVCNPNEVSKREDVIMRTAFGAGLVAVFVMLQFNQNLLRTPFWVHIGMCGVVLLPKFSLASVLRDDHRQEPKTTAIVAN